MPGCRVSSSPRSRNNGPRHESAPRGLVFTELSTPLLGLAVAASAGGMEVRYVTSTVVSSVGRRLLRRFSISPIVLEDEPYLPSSDRSLASPVWAANSYLNGLNLDRILKAFDEVHPGVGGLGDALRIALLKSMVMKRQKIFIVETWLRLRQYRAAHVIARGAATRRVIRHLECRPSVIWWPEWPHVAKGRLRQLIPTRGRVRKDQSAAVCKPDLLDPGSPLMVERLASPEAIFVSNMENTYGPLYRYDYLYSEDPESPLHPTRMALMARPWENFSAGIEEGGYPSRGRASVRLRRAVSLLAMAVRADRLRTPFWVHAFLAKFLATAECMAAEIRHHYPDARAAAFGFDTQVPSELAVAFRVAGVSTFAASERPANAADHSAVFSVEVLQTASSYFASAAETNWAIAIRKAEPLGMWRTDLLREGMLAKSPECIRAARAAGRRIAIALPYHLAHSGAAADDPIATSAPSVAHFLLGMLDLSANRADLHIVIRGKNADWLRDPRFRGIAERIERQSNLEVNTDYRSFNEAYRLCGHADVIIAKPTSLAEETLALGIPTLMHDYSHNLSGYVMGPWSHLPRDVWCLGDAELESKVDWALEADGAQFREWWEPHHRTIYGDMNDGSVRHRARARFEAMIGR